jgi:hypothetical protein
MLEKSENHLIVAYRVLCVCVVITEHTDISGLCYTDYWTCQIIAPHEVSIVDCCEIC